MWCFCTFSYHHNCNLTSGKIQCSENVYHCIIARSKKAVTQSCWEWNYNQNNCPDIVGKCIIIGNNLENPACCCKGDFCNSKMVNMINNVTNVNQTMQSSSVTSEYPVENVSFILPILLLITFIIIIIGTFTYVFIKNILQRNSKSVTRSLTISNKHENQLFLNNNLEENLICKCTKVKLIAQGRFGQVWLGMINGEKDNKEQNNIAIKIFSNNIINKKSWENESLIYSILRSQSHPYILHCFGAEQLHQSQEMWLVVQYHALGSLWEYLKHNTLNWKLVLSVSQNIAAGLSYLHSYSLSGIDAIAHRDIKSKNILLKDNLSACIADFGLAICNRNYEMTINNRVGTYNYMAPEILEGSINLSIRSCLSVDIFSMSLVFWELLNRCNFPGIIISKFTSAFEQMVGEKPTLNEMWNCVVTRNLRPKFNNYWSNFPEVITYWETLCECWDEDPDARLSSECVKIRLEHLQTLNEC